MGQKTKKRSGQARREAQLPNRKWAAIDNMYDLNGAPFRIDIHIKRLDASNDVLTSRWRGSADLAAFGRRTLEVAIFYAAAAQRDQEESDTASIQWPKLEATSEKVAALLDDLIGQLGPKDMPAEGAPDLVHVLTQVIFHGAATSNGPIGFEKAKEIGSQYADVLFSAREVVRQLEAASLTKGGQVASGRKNIGQRDKREFVRIFAEFWSCVTGARPPIGDDTQFDELLRNAWEDAGHSASCESFQSALREVVKSMGADEVAYLRDHLPSWR